MLADYSGNFNDCQGDPNDGPSGQQQRIIILWDLLKTRLRKSEVDEMARMIGTELIDNLESLRTELENLIQINKDLREEQNARTGGDTVADSKSLMSESQVNGQTSSIFSETKNASFLNQELLFFIDNLHQKAAESGLNEDALIPKSSAKDKKIYESLRPQSKLGRPQSAMQKDGKRLSEKENSPTHTAMRSSFYSMSMMGDSNIEAEDDDKEIARFQQEQATRGAVVNKVNFKNILELSQQEQETLSEIKKFMSVQADELQKEIDSMQQLMIQQAAAVAQDDQSDPGKDAEKAEDEVVTQKDLKQYTEKLKEEFLSSDHRLKIASLPSVTASTQSKKMNATGNSFTSYLNKYKPLPVVSGGTFKPAIGLGGLKTPIKLKLSTKQATVEQSMTQEQASIGSVKQSLPTVTPKTVTPLKAQLSAREAQLSARGSESARGGQDSARGGQLSARGAAYAKNAAAVYKEIREQNVKQAMVDGTPMKVKMNPGSGQKDSGEKPRRNSSAVKKIKIKRQDSKDRAASGRLLVKSRQGNQDPTAALGSSSGFQRKTVKLAKKSTASLTQPIQEPAIIDTSAARKDSPKQSTQSENLYGLDISLLKSLNMDHLLEEKKANQEQNTSKENWYLQNKGMEELRKEHALQPTTKGGANRLRLMCSHYTNNEDDKGETSD